MGQPCNNSPTGALILTGNLLVCVLKMTVASIFVVLISLTNNPPIINDHIKCTWQPDNYFITKDSNSIGQQQQPTQQFAQSVEKDGIL